MKEGIVPVVLTGRFLQQMTRHGFFWLPGVKYKLGTKHGDLDLLACCDGEVVFCECKRLDQTPPGAKVWDEVVSQFLDTAEIAKRCKGSLAVLSAQVDAYPDDVKSRIDTAIGKSIPYLLLNKHDLEAGHRKRPDGHGHLNLSDLLTVPFREEARARGGKARTINMGWGVFTE
jgi:hypothetical protein